jgi:GT2 family glycosyltransferase
MPDGMRIACGEIAMTPSPVSAIVTAFSRVEKTQQTLTNIYQCRPQPSEVIVHVDGGNDAFANDLRAHFPSARVLVSQGHVGPGGGRNLLISESSQELVASFDDDSHPLDTDFFSRVTRVSNEFPHAAMFAAAVMEPSSGEMKEARPSRTATFVGCGCVYRRSIFQMTSGYVPLALAYGMEEVDLSMQLHAMNQVILKCPELRVYHDTSMAHRFRSEVNAAVVINAALLVFLRYPITLWPLGMVQVARSILDLMKQKRFAGIWSGIMRVPGECAHRRQYRKTLSTSATLSYLLFRRHCSREEIAP